MQTIIRGKVWKFGDYISTDLIAPGRYFHLRSNLKELSKHVLEEANHEFAQKVCPGDIIVAGKNFGMGSSREHAPQIIKIAGAGAVLAESFARIFFRNAINIGLPTIAIDTEEFQSGNQVEVDLVNGIVHNRTNDLRIKFDPMPRIMTEILNDGGVLNHVIAHRGFNI